MELLIDRVESPIGQIVLVAEARALVALDFADCEPRMLRLLARRWPAASFVPAADPLGASGRLRAYFGGVLTALDDLAVETGGTPFQQALWQALRTIPPGTTMSYGALASRLGRPTAQRAVGYANSLNPVAIVLPCHRVIGAGKALTGYAGGLERKRWLLRHEGAVVQ